MLFYGKKTNMLVELFNSEGALGVLSHSLLFLAMGYCLYVFISFNLLQISELSNIGNPAYYEPLTTLAAARKGRSRD